MTHRHGGVHPARVLVADDDRATRTFLVHVLERAGHRVEAFEDGDQLWEAFVRCPPALVVSDWQMPRLDGIALCRRVRLTPVRVPFLIVTSLTREEHLAEARAAGVDDMLAKPLARATLLARVRAALPPRSEALSFTGAP